MLPQNALTDSQRVRIPSISEYWKPLAEDVSIYLRSIDEVFEYKFCFKLRFDIYSSLLNCTSEMQMDDSAGIEAEYHHKNNRVSFYVHIFSI